MAYNNNSLSFAFALLLSRAKLMQVPWKARRETRRKGNKNVNERNSIVLRELNTGVSLGTHFYY